MNLYRIEIGLLQSQVGTFDLVDTDGKKQLPEMSGDVLDDFFVDDPDYDSVDFLFGEIKFDRDIVRDDQGNPHLIDGKHLLASGTKASFDVMVEDGVSEDYVEIIFDALAERGFGKWRGAVDLDQLAVKVTLV
jgi:hypothetical protein